MAIVSESKNEDDLISQRTVNPMNSAVSMNMDSFVDNAAHNNNELVAKLQDEINKVQAI